jgi:hypothetical protein
MNMFWHNMFGTVPVKSGLKATFNNSASRVKEPRSGNGPENVLLARIKNTRAVKWSNAAGKDPVKLFLFNQSSV